MLNDRRQERHGLEPGIVVEPAEIPDRYTQLLAARTLSGPDRPDEAVAVAGVRGPVNLSAWCLNTDSQANFDLNGGP